MTQDVAVCYRHPNRATRLSCSECGRPICVECSIDAPVGQKCPECSAHQGRGSVIDARRNLSASGTPATYTLIAISVLIYLANGTAIGEELFQRGAQANGLVMIGEWWRILTAALFHGGLTHLLFNMWALHVLGPQIERQVGSPAFVAAYLAAAAGGGAAVLFMEGPFTVVVGASGAIFGLFGLWIQAAWRRRATASGRQLLSQLGFILAINAVLPLMIPRIAWQGHVGGLATGLLIGWLWEKVGRDRTAQLMVSVGVAAGLVGIVVVFGGV